MATFGRHEQGQVKRHRGRRGPGNPPSFMTKPVINGYFGDRPASVVELDRYGKPVRQQVVENETQEAADDETETQQVVETQVPGGTEDMAKTEDLEPGPGEEEEEEDDEEEEEETEDEPVGVAAPPAPPPVPSGKGKGRRPPTRRPRLSSPGGIHGPTADEYAGVSKPPSDSQWPADAAEMWPRIVEESYKLGRTPHDIFITCERFGLSGYNSEPVQLAQIEGAAVMGGEGVSPAQAFMDYVEQIIHSSSTGPARYRFQFCWKRGNKIKIGELRLAHPQELARQRALAMQRQQVQGQPRAPQYPGMPYAGMGAPAQAYGPPQPYPQPAYYQPPAYYPPPAPQQVAADPATEGMRREMATMMGRFDEMMRQQAEARGLPPPPPMAPPPPAAAPSLATEIAAGVAQALRAAGISAQPASQGPVGLGSVISNAKQQMSGLTEILGVMKDFQKLKDGFGAVMGEEPDATEVPAPIVEDKNAPPFGVRAIPLAKFRGNPVLWAEREEGETLLEWLPKMAAANPEAASGFLEQALRVLDQGAFGALLRKFAQQGGPAAQAAATMADRVANGSAVPGVGHAPPGVGRDYPVP